MPVIFKSYLFNIIWIFNDAVSNTISFYGLFRIDFLFKISDRLPSEVTHFLPVMNFIPIASDRLDFHNDVFLCNSTSFP